MKRKIKNFVAGVTAFVSSIGSKERKFSKTVKPSKRVARHFQSGYPRTKEERAACRPELYANFVDIVEKLIVAKEVIRNHAARNSPQSASKERSYIAIESALETDARVFWAQMARWNLLPIDWVRSVRWRNFDAFLKDVLADRSVLENIQKLPRRELVCA